MSISNSKLIILYNVPTHSVPASDTTVITFLEFRKWLKQRAFLNHLFKYRQVQLLSYRIEVIPRPFIFVLLLRLLSRGSCQIYGRQGQEQTVTTGFIFNLLQQFVKNLSQQQKILHQIQQEVEDLSDEYNVSRSIQNLDLLVVPIYLRTDLWFGIRSGGSVGHIAGVLNELDNFTGSPILITTDFIPTVRPDIKVKEIIPGPKFWNFPEIVSLAFNNELYKATKNYLQNKKLSFIYQRYSQNNYTGLKLAKFYNIPLVIEYNGSIIWMTKHWGEGLKYKALTEQIELLNLNSADVIVVVSQPMKDELTARNIEPDKILVNPNGVDPDRYSPSIDGSQIRQKYGWQEKIVLGFIGTFGPWHGAEILAEAFGRLWQEFPTLRQKVRLLMIGDGITMPLVKQNLSKFEVDSDMYALTGLVPQEQGAEHLAACDILLSPHVPNSDGTPFFGSPTKLFEYMAMGKGIVASDLDQIGEILEHKRTALLVKPADVQSLLEGMKTLIDDEALRHKLGEAARHEVVAKYSWREHTKKTIEKLKERCG